MTNRQIVIVGAGIAGLTAAYFLKQAGYHPLVLEKSGRVGGRMITDVVEGFTIDCGAQFLMDSYPILTSLIARNGLNSNFIQTSQYMGIVRDGKIHKTLRGDILSLLKSGALSFPGWLRFLARSLPLVVKTSSLPINDYTAWTHDDDEDTETWSNSYFGQEVTDYILEPTFEGLFFQPLREVSRAFSISILSTFLYRKTKNTTALTGGIGVLPECLGSQIEVLANTPVVSMSMGKSGVELETGAGLMNADRVILATTAQVSQAIYPSPGMIERELLATQYSSTLVIAAAMQDSFHLEPDIEGIYGILVPKKERSVISSISIEASKDKLRLSGGQLLVVCLSGKAGKEMIEWKEEAILPVV
jgi:oxygen-dependent protoporphyrinogen oxidase